MRRLSSAGESFSIVFAGFEKTTGKATGIHQVNRCQLRAATPIAGNKYSDYFLNIIDLDTNKPRKCWQPLVLYFNNQKISLHGNAAN